MSKQWKRQRKENMQWELISEIPMGIHCVMCDVWNSRVWYHVSSWLFTLLIFSHHFAFSFSSSRFWGYSAGESLWTGRIAPGFLHHTHHEWPGICRNICSLFLDLCNCQCVFLFFYFFIFQHILLILCVMTFLAYVVFLTLMFPAGSEMQDSAFGYFITACVVIVLAIASYIALPRMVRLWLLKCITVNKITLTLRHFRVYMHPFFFKIYCKAYLSVAVRTIRITRFLY